MQHVGSYFPRPGMEPVLSVLDGWSLNQWTCREVPQLPSLSRLALHLFKSHLPFPTPPALTTCKLATLFFYICHSLRLLAPHPCKWYLLPGLLSLPPIFQAPAKFPPSPRSFWMFTTPASQPALLLPLCRF